MVAAIQFRIKLADPVFVKVHYSTQYLYLEIDDSSAQVHSMVTIKCTESQCNLQTKFLFKPDTHHALPKDPKKKYLGAMISHRD